MTKFIKFKIKSANGKEMRVNVARIRCYSKHPDGGTHLEVGNSNPHAVESVDYFDNLLDFVDDLD